jgi:hypothetical protein
LLFEEIKKAEDLKKRNIEENKCSDDEFSEGSSDG